MTHHKDDKPNVLARMMDSKAVHGLIGILVIVNAVVLGMMSYYKPDELMFVKLELISHVILAVFTVEILLRLLGHGLRYFRNGWNVFDFIVVIGSLLPYTGGATILRSILVFRLFYLIEISKKMRHILHGLSMAFNGIFHVVLLMVVVFYAYAIIGVNFFAHPEVAQFASLSAAFHTLFQVLTGDDWYNVMRGVTSHFPYAWIYFYSYYLAMSFVILNFFIGVIVGALQNAEEAVDEKTPSSNEDDGQVKVQRALDDLKAEIMTLRKELSVKREAEKAPAKAGTAKSGPTKKVKTTE